jgi:exodeoxyribonuclease V alpha subunit
MQIYRTYGQRSIAAIKENPYQLAETVRGIGFKTADELAQRLGMPADAPERARAAVRFVLAELTEEGHCGYAESQVVDRTVELVRVERRIIEDAVAFELEQGNVVRDRHEEQDWLALRALYQCEWGIASVLKRLLSDSAHPLPQIKVDVALQWVQHRLGLELAAAQQEAIRMVCRHKPESGRQRSCGAFWRSSPPRN